MVFGVDAVGLFWRVFNWVSLESSETILSDVFFDAFFEVYGFFTFDYKALSYIDFLSPLTLVGDFWFLTMFLSSSISDYESWRLIVLFMVFSENSFLILFNLSVLNPSFNRSLDLI